MIQQAHTVSEAFHHIYKWIVLASFSFNSFSNLFLCDAISPIWSFVAVYYNTNDYDLNWYVNWYYITPITFSFLINPLILKNFGLSQILSCSLTAIGLWILVLVKQSFYLGLVGFMFLGFGEASYYQVPLHLSKIWFEPKERIFSTFVAQYITTSASFLGYTISTFYFYGIVDQEEFNLKYQQLVEINAIIATIIVGINFTTLKAPENTKITVQMRESIWNSIYKMLTNLESIYDLLSVSTCINISKLVIGMSWCYPLLFSTQQYSIGQSYMDVNKVNMAFYFGQLISATICTQQLQKQSDQGLQLEYDKYIKYTTGIGFIFLVIEILFFDMITGNWLTAINIFIGAGMGGIQSIVLESLMEKHFPVQELVIGTILTAVASAEYLIITMIMSIPQYSSYGFQIACFLIVPSFCYILVFYETQFKRFECEA